MFPPAAAETAVRYAPAFPPFTLVALGTYGRPSSGGYPGATGVARPTRVAAASASTTPLTTSRTPQAKCGDGAAPTHASELSAAPGELFTCSVQGRKLAGCGRIRLGAVGVEERGAVRERRRTVANDGNCNTATWANLDRIIIGQTKIKRACSRRRRREKCDAAGAACVCVYVQRYRAGGGGGV